MQSCTNSNGKIQHLEDFLPNYQPTVDFCLHYQLLVYSWIYAIVGTNMDLAYVVSIVSWYIFWPNNFYWQAVKQIFRYIKGTLDVELIFRRLLKTFERYKDVNWARDRNTQRSISGFLFKLRSSAINWSSKRQPIVTFWRYEADYMGQTQAIKEEV